MNHAPSQTQDDDCNNPVGQKRLRTNVNHDENPSKRHEPELPLRPNLNADSDLTHDQGLGLSDDLNMDDFLPDAAPGNGGNWLLDDINDAALNASTQYLELHELPADSDAELLPQPFQPHRNVAFDMSADPFNIPQDSLVFDQPTQNITTATMSATTTATSPATAASTTTTAVPIVNTPPSPTSEPTANQQMQDTISSAPLTSRRWHRNANPNSQPATAVDSFLPSQVPEIKTHIILTNEQVHARSNSFPSSSAVRIAPRDVSNSEQQPRTSSSSRGRNGSIRKRSRNNTSSASPPARVTIQNRVSPRPSQSATKSNFPRNQQHIQPAPAPHPMVAPMLFAQGFEQASPQPVQKPNFPPSSQPQTQDAAQQNPTQKLSPFVPLQVPAPVAAGTKSGENSTQQNTPVSDPMASPRVLPGTPGMMPVDPNVLMQMAQQMWCAAMAASGNTPLPQSLPGPNHPPLFNAPPAFVQPQHNQGSLQLPNPNSIKNNSNVQPNPQSAKTHPVFITDNGEHVIVEQQAPAKLMRHPVLGRLQLQSKHQAALERANTAGSTHEPSPTKQNDNNVSASISSPASTTKDRRKRLVWTPELHDRFIQAISAVGIHQAVPKTLVQIMNVEGLTTEHVKSHLQKYRNSLRKAACDDERDKRKDPPPRLILRPSIEHDNRAAREVRIVPNRALVAATRPMPSVTRVPMAHHPLVNQPSTAPVRLQPKLTVGNAPNSSTPPEQNHCPQSNEPKHDLKVEEKPAPPQQATPVQVPKDEKQEKEDTEKQDNDSQEKEDTEKQDNDSQEQEQEIPVLTGTTEEMHERTMQLQYQLQVLVHRTVELQKQLQIKIGKQGKPTCIQAESKPNNANKNQDEQVEQDDKDNTDEEKKKMQLEYLDSLRQSQKVRRELGIIQKELGKKNQLQQQQ